MNPGRREATLPTPPLLLGATLAFWGYQTGFLAVGLILGVGLESARWIGRRWEYSAEEFNQLWNITVLLFLGAAAYVFASSDGLGTVGSFFSANSFTDRSHALDKASETMFVFLRLLPMVFFPFTVVQAYSTQPRVDFRTFSWFLRRRARAQRAGPGPTGRGVNAAFPFFAVCLLSASTAKVTEHVFFVGLAVLVGWALWTVRSPRVAVVSWVVCLGAAIALGYGTAAGLRNLQQVVDALHVQILSNFRLAGRGLKEIQTSIGQVGRLKGSGQIVLRVAFPPGTPVRPLLREATYNYFRSPEWRAAGGRREFAQMFPETNETSWVFAEGPSEPPFSIAAYLSGGQGPLILPHAVTRVDELGVFDLKTNHLGTARVDTGPGLVIYRAAWGGLGGFDGPPDEAFDLQVPTNEQPAVARVAEELGLGALPESERPPALERYFARHFAYSLYEDHAALATNREVRTPLAHFLLRSKAGHCEYFATATTLLLRQAGVPARYALGYSVQEHAGEGRYVVRARHAHAWCLYYDRATGRWRELDTTPGGWIDRENERRSLFEPVGDLFAWGWFQISKLRWGLGGLRRYIFYAVVVVLALVVARFIQQKRGRRRPRAVGAADAGGLRAGLDSEFYQVERRLAARGWERRTSESVLDWLARIRPHVEVDEGEMRGVIDLHYRLRFDPKGLSREERARLRERVAALLAGLSG